MKFKVFLKVLGLSLAIFTGGVAAGTGILALTGFFSEPEVLPTDIAFEFSEYNVDGDFVAKIISTTPDINVLDLDLSLNANNIVEKDGRISDGVISIPKSAKINEEFTVILEKTENDAECDGLAWITGGHSEIVAKFTRNAEMRSTKATVNVDVPVYAVKLITSPYSSIAELISNANINLDENSLASFVNTSPYLRYLSKDAKSYVSSLLIKGNVKDVDDFVLTSKFYSYLEFYPKRSEFRYSFDGKNATGGYDINNEPRFKGTYFTLQANDDDYLEQVNDNLFVANKIGDEGTIVGYCFTSSTYEENILSSYSALYDKSILNGKILELLENNVSSKLAVKASKQLNVIDIDVDTLTIKGSVQNLNLDTLYTLYANKASNEINSFDLKILLSSSVIKDVSLQSKLTNVGIRFLVKDGENFVSADDYIEMLPEFYSKITTIKMDGSENTKELYLPILTKNIEDYHWQLLVKQNYTNAIYLEICYFDDNDTQVGFGRIPFSINNVVSSNVYWDESIKNYNDIIIFDNENDEEITFEEFDLKPYSKVPADNLYKSVKYYAYSTEGENLNELLNVSEPVNYVINSQTYTLYELEDGIVQAKTVDAYGITFNVLFMTIQTDYLGRPKMSNDSYIYDQYSREKDLDDLNIKSVVFTVSKTLRNFVSYMEFNQNPETFIHTETVVSDDETRNVAAIVQNSYKPFDVIFSYSDEKDEKDDKIFTELITNSKIDIIAKTDNVITTLITLNTKTLVKSENDTDPSYCIYSMDVSSLPMGTVSELIQLFIRYNMTNDRFVDIPVKMFFSNISEEDYEDGYEADYIEIYNGEAVVFQFNLNYALSQNEVDEDEQPIGFVTTNDNRLKISTQIESNELLVSEISTGYSVTSATKTDAEKELFIEKTNYLNIVTKDKYGKMPLSSEYTIVSTDSKILSVITNNEGVMINFISAGNVELQLLNANSVVKDTLYITLESAKSINKITKMYENHNKANGTSEYLFTEHDITEKYEFPTETISIYGAIDKSILFNSTTNGDVNLLTYYIEGKSLINFMKFELVNSADKVTYADFINFTLDKDDKYISKLSFVKDFECSASIQLRVTVSELKISQLIVLDVKPNLTLSISIPQASVQSGAISKTGIQNYDGVFAKSVYRVNVTLEYSIKHSSYSTYKFYVGDGLVENTYSEDSGRTNQIRILSSDKVFKNTSTDKLSQQFVVDFELNDVYELTELVVSLKSKAEISAFETSASLFLYINPNAKVVYNPNIIYLESSTASCGLYSADYISVERMYDNYDVYSYSEDNSINAEAISFEVDSKSGFNIVGKSISGPASLTEIKNVDCSVKYGGYKIGNVKLTISPNIKINDANFAENWVVYGGKTYLKLVNNYIYHTKNESFEPNHVNLKNAFTYTNLKDIKFADNSTIVNYVRGDESGEENYFTITSTNMYDRSILQKDEFTITVTLVGGYSLTYNFIILPIDTPFVQYYDGDDNIIDLSREDLMNILDPNWIVSELGDIISPYKSGNYDVILAEDELELNRGIIDVSSKDNIKYSTANYDKNDLFEYTSISSGVLTITPSGQQTYTVVYLNLNYTLTDALVIPYVIKITPELSMAMYYPYQDNALISGERSEPSVQDLSSASSTFAREYVSFAENAKSLSLNLAGKISDMPNKPSDDYEYRIAILKANDLGENEIYDSYINISYQVVAVYNSRDEWSGYMQVSDIQRYATITNKVITINSNEYSKIRVVVKVSTLNGLMGYYYISVGEIPAMYFAYSADGSVVDTISITAGVENADKNIVSTSTYVLRSDSKNRIETITSALRFYNKDGKLHIDENGLWADDCVNNFETSLTYYTYYGEVKTISVLVKTNYVLKVSETVVPSGTTAVDEYECGQVLDLYNVFELSKNSNPLTIDKIVLTPANDYSKYLRYDEDNGLLTIGVVSANTTFDFNAVLEFKDDEVDCEYNVHYTFVVKPELIVASISETNLQITRDNQYNAGEAISSKEVDLKALFTTISPSADVYDWIYNVSQQDIITIRCISLSLAGFDFGISENQTNIMISKLPKVMDPTTYSFAVQVINFEEEIIMSSYFQILVNPAFRIEYNYPQSSGSAFNVEHFFVGTIETPKEFQLTKESIITDVARIRVLNWDDDLEYAALNDIRVTVNNESVIANASPSGQYNIDDIFNFNLTTSVEDITFSLHFSDDLEHEIGFYNVKLYSSIGSVWSITTSNFNTTNSVNASSNHEQIYIGTGDDIFKKVEVKYTISTPWTLEDHIYASISSIYGVQTDIDNGRKDLVYGQSTVSTFVYLLDDEFNFDKLATSLEFVFTNQNGDAVIPEEEISFEVVNIKSRVTLKYYNTICFIGDTYSALGLSALQTGIVKTDIEYSLDVKLNEEFSLGTYFVDRTIDVMFTEKPGNNIKYVNGNYTVYLYANQTASLLNGNTNVTKNLGMKRISNGVYYEKPLTGVASWTVSYSINPEKVVGNDGTNDIYNNNDLGNLRIDNSTSFDLTFLAMGAAGFVDHTTRAITNEPITIVVTITVKMTGGDEKDFDIYFVISNDYVNLSLRNNDGSGNSANNRNYVLDGVITFAKTGSTEIDDNNIIFIQHEFATADSTIGNIVPFFTVTFDNAYSMYAKRENSTSALNITFSEVPFGSSNIDITFVDAYGFTFTYFVTLVAKYSPSYNSGTISVYEEDNIKLVTEQITSDSETKVALIRIDASDINDNNKPVMVTNIELLHDESVFTYGGKTTRLSKTSSSLLYTTAVEEEYNIKIGIFDDEDFNSSKQISGTLKLVFVYEGSKAIITIKIVINQKYSIESVDDVLYARDGESFNLFDTFNVVDNKSGVNVGDMELKDVQSAKLTFEVKFLENAQTPGDNDAANDANASSILHDALTNEGIVIGIRAYNKNSGTYIYRSITEFEDDETNRLINVYVSLQDLFDIESINNYTFTLGFYDLLGKWNDMRYTGDGESGTYTLSTNVSTLESEQVYYAKYKGEDLVEDVNEVDKFNYFKISVKSSQIIEDESFSIVLREIENDSIRIKFNNFSSGIKTLTIPCKEGGRKLYSLHQMGIINPGEKTVLYTGYEIPNDTNSIYFSKGISYSDLSRLKNIVFYQKDGSVDKEMTTPVVTMHLDLSENEVLSSENITENGITTTVLYKNKVLSGYGVNYAEGTKKQDLNKEIRLTLKYISVDTISSYGSESLRYIENYSIESSGNYSVSVAQWAGERTENTAFKLIPGYTKATVSNDELILSENADNLYFEINKDLCSADVQSISISSSGTLTIDPQNFNIFNEYLAIDVYVKLSNTGENNYGKPYYKDKIYTVKIAFKNSSYNSMESTGISQIVGYKVNTRYKFYDGDLLELLKARTTSGNYVLGENIVSKFNKNNNFELNIIFKDGDEVNKSTRTLSNLYELNDVEYALENGKLYLYIINDLDKHKSVIDLYTYKPTSVNGDFYIHSDFGDPDEYEDYFVNEISIVNERYIDLNSSSYSEFYYACGIDSINKEYMYSNIFLDTVYGDKVSLATAISGDKYFKDLPEDNIKIVPVGLSKVSYKKYSLSITKPSDETKYITQNEIFINTYSVSPDIIKPANFDLNKVLTVSTAGGNEYSITTVQPTVKVLTKVSDGDEDYYTFKISNKEYLDSAGQPLDLNGIEIFLNGDSYDDITIQTDAEGDYIELKLMESEVGTDKLNTLTIKLASGNYQYMYLLYTTEDASAVSTYSGLDIYNFIANYYGYSLSSILLKLSISRGGDKTETTIPYDSLSINDEDDSITKIEITCFVRISTSFDGDKECNLFKITYGEDC